MHSYRVGEGSTGLPLKDSVLVYSPDVYPLSDKLFATLSVLVWLARQAKKCKKLQAQGCIDAAAGQEFGVSVPYCRLYLMLSASAIEAQWNSVSR